MFSLKSICNRIQVDKASINKINDKSAIHTKSMRYSKYVNPGSGNYRTIVEGQVTSITMTYATPHTATVVFTYVSNPVYFEMLLVNIQDAKDRHMFEVYESPYTFTGLRPNSYYTITTYATFVSTNTYTKVYPMAIQTLFEGPPTDLSMNNILNISAVLNFTPSIGYPTNFTLNIIDTKDPDPTNILFFQHVKPPFSPFIITGLQPDITYDVSLSSYYSATNNTYHVYKSAFFQTYDENYPVLNSIYNITNVGATITIEYTGTPSYNLLQLINVKDSTDTYTIKDTELNNTNTFDGLRIDASYNLTVTSVYITGHTFSIRQPNAFHTWNENVIPSAQIIQILGHEIRITYTAAIGKVLNYIVSLTDTNDNTFTQSFQNVPNYVLFSNLEVNTNYTLTIATVYILNTYMYIYPTYIQTLNEGPVIDISCSNISNTSAVIYFPASPGIDMTYNITYRGERNNTKSYSINGFTSTEIRLTGLSIYTPYSVIITTHYPQNSYSFGKQTLFTTLNEGATTIRDVTVQSNNKAIDITIINTYGNPTRYSFYAMSSSSVNIVGDYIGLANIPYTYTLRGLSGGVPYTVSVVTKYDTENSYKTTWPLTIDIPSTTPAMPNISLKGEDSSIVMTFSANNDGGSPITSYQYSKDDFMSDINTISINSSPYTIHDLINGISYNIKLRAVNKNGYSDKTNSPDITPVSKPSAPTIISITTPTNTTAILNFEAPTSNGGLEITSYQYSINAGENFTEFSSGQTTTPYIITTGLYAGQEYSIQLQAVNSIGPGPATASYTIIMPNKASAIGGTTIPNSGGYTYHIFTNTTADSNTILFTQGGDIDYFIIGGGGAGGSSHGGGGSSGELLYGSTTASDNTSYTIMVGAGGIVTGTEAVSSINTNGGDSSISFTPPIMCKGGGRGGGALTGMNNDGNPLNGGGGSGYGTGSSTGEPFTKNNINGFIGNKGGNAIRITIDPIAGGGGSGASTALSGNDSNNSGGEPTSTIGSGCQGGQGPDGLTNAEINTWLGAIYSSMPPEFQNAVLHNAKYYIGSGGCGGSWGRCDTTNVAITTLPKGGGGNGGMQNNGYSLPDIEPTPGIPNTGSGGGGGGSGGQLGANGGSGLVVVRYLV